MPQLLDITITPEQLAGTMVVLVLDLSKPSTVVETAQFWLQRVRARVASLISAAQRNSSSSSSSSLSGQQQQQQPSLTASSAQMLREAASAAFGAQHPDASRVDLMPVPVLIVGTKLDLLLSGGGGGGVNAEQLKVMSRTLRALAHHNGCSLLYMAVGAPQSSSSSAAGGDRNALVPVFRNLLTRHAVQSLAHRAAAGAGGGGGSGHAMGSKGLQTDFSKPIAVPRAGQDAWTSIGDAAAAGSSSSSKSSPALLQSWLALYLQTFPPKLGDTPDEDAKVRAKRSGALALFDCVCVCVCV